MREDPDIYSNPTVPYKRTIVKTKQNWAFELIRRGKTKVLFQYLMIWAIVIILCGIGLFLFINFIMETFL